jgi:hypothetical protein
MINKVKKYISAVPRSTKSTIILLGGTMLVIFYLSATKLDPPLIVAEEKVWPVSAQKVAIEVVYLDTQLVGQKRAKLSLRQRLMVGQALLLIGKK